MYITMIIVRCIDCNSKKITTTNYGIIQMETQVSSQFAITLYTTFIIIKGKHRKQFNNRNRGDFIIRQ